MWIHGNDQFRIGTIQNFLPDAPTLAADDHGHGRQFRLPQILCPIRQCRHADGDTGSVQAFLGFRPGGLDDLVAKHRAHGGTDNLMTKRVGAAFQQRHGNIQRVSGAQDGARLPGS